MIGQVISHYQILEKLGGGGMGVVYKARDVKLGRFVALKFLPPSMGSNEEQKARFLQEAQAASTIDHPNIGSVYEINETPDGQMYIVMACYEGQNLKEAIRKGQLSIDQTVDIALQIAHGMVKAHESGIIHRDLKPANVILTHEGVAKIIDFGLAKLSGGTQLTRTGTSVGTVAYMSPEQARGEEVGPTADIWSMGVIIYEMLAGRLPFRGDFETAMLYSIANEDPPHLVTLRPEVPPELQRIVEKALEKEPSARYQTMEEMTEALTALKKHIEAGTASETSKELAARLFHTVMDRRTTLVAGGAALIVVVALILVFVRPFAPNAPRSVLTRSIAILPFATMGDSSNEYYADGFTQDITGDISRLPELLVISNSSSLSPKGLALSDSTISTELGVQYLLKGELRLSVARIVLSARLYDAEQHKEVWSETYDQSRDDPLGVKQRLIAKIADILGVKVDTATFFRHRPATDIYEAYLNGSHLSGKKQKEDNRMAREYFLEAIRKDSLYTPALISLANTDIENYRQDWDKSAAILQEAEVYCRKVLAKDTGNAAALALLGDAAHLRGNRDEALRLLQRAITFDKNNVLALTLLSFMYLTELNEPAKAVVYLKRLQEFNPNDWMMTLNLGVGYGQIKNYPEAKRAFRRAMHLNPAHEWPPNAMGYTCERLGEYDSAVIYYRLALEINPKFAGSYENLASVLLATGTYAAAESLLTRGIRLLEGEHQLLYTLGLARFMRNNKTSAQRTFAEGLAVAEKDMAQHPTMADNYAWAALYEARLGKTAKAVQYATTAARLDSTGEDITLKVARCYSILGNKGKMLEWYKRAISMNPEYDVPYLMTAIDFEKYRKDPDLLAIARR